MDSDQWIRDLFVCLFFEKISMNAWTIGSVYQNRSSLDATVYVGSQSLHIFYVKS